MIIAIHTLIYSDDPTATRAFLRDVLGWPYVEDVGTEPGWLIFGTGPSEMGVHPTRAEHGGRVFESSRHHEISLVCDSIDATRTELSERGATFASDVVDRGFGLTCLLEVPGADPVMLYEPRHATAYDQ
jgi:catechol 2,3-dioxygenase-like lactoylglutathione lyase family enzyme